MAHGELASACDVYSDFARRRVIRMQGPCWYFCTFDGYRSNVWAHGRYYCEGAIQVCRTLFFAKEISVRLLGIGRAYPTSGIFAVCQPDVPCITPGTYAFLGAAAALRWVLADVSFFLSSLFTELVVQWRYANYYHRCGHHVRAHWCPDIYSTNYGSLLF